MVTYTIKGLSDEVYRLLKKLAAAEHRSVNRQIILMIEQQVAHQTIDVKAWLAENARLRKRFPMKPLTMDDIDAAKKKGRP